MKRRPLINYIHATQLGTVGEIQGEIKAVWTIVDNDKKHIYEIAFSDEEFMILWGVGA